MITESDLQAATAAGIIDEQQAARLLGLSHARAGRISLGLAEDEPFELFQGFAEIFISIGLILLIGSGLAFAGAIGGTIAIALALIILSWFAASYFTLKRRMTLPSIVLVTGYALGVVSSINVVFDMARLPNAGWIVAVAGLFGMCLMLVHYRNFRVPFSMFLTGLFGIAVISGVTGAITPAAISGGNLSDVFDLRQGNALALATLVFGLCCFAGALWFDMRDPHRLGRMARSAFWLHLLAAPALVNTVLMTAYNTQGLSGMILTILGLLMITILALVIDRRSFLTAGLGYLAAIIITLLQQGDGDLSIPTLMLVLGAIVTYLGTFWINLRMRLMRALPDFPGKSRLPPYSESP